MATRVRPVKAATPAKISTLAGIPGVRVASAPVEVVKTTPGPVTTWQKISAYYKGIVAFVGTVLTLLTAPEIGPLSHLLPDPYQHWLTVGVGVITVVLTFLKENEHWFDGAAVTTAAE